MKITAYSDRVSARPGETIQFMVNCELPEYRADIVRITCGDTNPAGPGVKEQTVRTTVTGKYPGRRQVIEAGSYATIPSHRELEQLSSFSFQAMVWPTLPSAGRQFIMSKWRAHSRSGMAVTIEADGSLGVMLGGDAGLEIITTGVALLARQWYFIAVSFDAASRNVTLYQDPSVDYPTVEQAAETRIRAKTKRIGRNRAALMFAGARSGSDKLVGCYNGKIDSPRLANRALRRSEMEALKAGVPAKLQTAIVGAWDFSRDITSSRVSDISPNALHGEVSNLPARAMKGYNWTGEAMDWRQAPEQYGAIHFHDDDVYDAGWEVDFELTVPPTMRSGLYAARLRSGDAEEYVPFAVKPERGDEAKIAFLLPTASYMAYANEHFGFNVGGVELLGGRLTPIDEQSLFLNEHREYGASCYDHHTDGSGVCYSSRLRPILNMRPKHISPLGGHGSSLWQFNADTHITDWLEAKGYEYDVITDEDLHAEGLELLRPYSVVLSGTHPEYHSEAMWDAMYSYQNQGGRLMYMGANGWYWRIAYHPDLPGVMELRRNEGGIRAWPSAPGEYYHSFSGEYGGLWRNQGRPPQVLTGVGFTAQGFDISAPYQRLPDSYERRAAFIFKGIGKREVIGDFGLIGGGAAGLELDRADPALGTPPHALVLATSQGAHTDVYLVVCEEILVTIPGLGGTENELVRADMVFYETPHGGGVWSSGSIAWAGSLSHNDYDNNVSRLTQNVLNRFLDPKSLAK